MGRAKVERDKDKVKPMFDFQDFLGFMAINDAMEEERWSHEFTEIRTHEIRTEKNDKI